LLIGKVYAGKWNNIDVAVKVFDEMHISFILEDFTREVAMMRYKL
jgi:hypothetical protein